MGITTLKIEYDYTKAVWTPKCWTNFVDSIPFPCRFQDIDNLLKEQFNAKLRENLKEHITNDETHIDFETEDDLMRFLLIWS